MLATFVIGLREGLEAALIVGIVAGFLRQRGEDRALRPMWLGVALAVLICLAVAVILQVVAADLPQQEQEGMESIIGVIAVAMITYMIIWMRRHARGMRRELEAAAESALARGSTWALVAMAFLAVLREGFETTVFLLAAFSSSTSPVAAGAGALLGILIAVAVGYGIYRGSVRLDLARFFTITAVFLVLVAAGLLASAVHTAHEATWINFGQEQIADLSAVVQPGTPISSLVTGVLGIQPRPTVIEFVVWLVYLVPMLVYVLWPQRRRAVTPAAATAST
ncbi:iron permease [Actinomycetospora sp. NBRC 106375]|uniref:iron uptake transporter permease EfeU n=1 Tax=Actinomycetospora sp. NBRC 106375 TaxID=3032207 RepID=UPI0024A183F4|nr:iron uptake transporter permease EfeU [Actinomycetospora sp. NBRC 106375]GLZ46832.1 iron permease [Actinomycetospora sp. NBRC 106375]